MHTNGKHPPAQTDDMEWIDLQEASALAGYHPDHVKRLLRRGLVRGRKRGGWWVDKESLEAYVTTMQLLGSKKYDPGGLPDPNTHQVD